MKEEVRRQGLADLSGTMPGERTASLLKFLEPVTKCTVSSFWKHTWHQVQEVG